MQDTLLPEIRKLKTQGILSPRSSSATAAIAKYIYTFGGMKDDLKADSIAFYNDLYRFDTSGNEWEQLSPAGEAPSAMGFANAVNYKDALIIFGGVSYEKKFANLKIYENIWSYSPKANSWTKLKPSNQGPAARSGPCMWIQGDSLFIFGGSNPIGKKFNDTWEYNLATNTWSELVPNNAADSPVAVHDALNGTTAINGRLIMYGGIGGLINPEKHEFQITNDTWEFTLAAKKWRKVTPDGENNIKPPRTGAAVGVLNNKFYLQGGNIYISESKEYTAQASQSISNEVWCFDPSASKWTKLKVTGAAPQLKRANFTVLNNKLYIFSGFDMQGANQVWNQDVYVLSPNSD